MEPKFKRNLIDHLSDPNLPRSSRSWFWANEVANIYKIPPPTNNNVVVAVVSFGGGLYGTLDSSGNLTNSDAEKYWLSLGISPSNIPKVMIKTIDGAKNKPKDTDSGETMENTIDIETIGACCPTSKLTIILYIAPNDLNEFPRLINYILNDTILINNVNYTPSVISISWGAPEIYYGNSLLNSINNLFSVAINKGINITVATGDNGSNDGVGGNGSYCDFPSSSPNVTAVGGTKLYCPNYIYNKNTIETAWSSGGGAISNYFKKPSYQNLLNVTKRSTPDIALVSDPNTGIRYLLNGYTYIIGGTSIASPIFAGFLAAINANKFINPIIYSAGTICFNDIKTGSNGHFKAKINYDNCTGFGSIKGDILNNVYNTNLITSNSNLTIFYKTKSQLLISSNLDSNLFTFSSNNQKIVTIDKLGYITATGLGSTIININTPNPYVTKTINITVLMSTQLKIKTYYKNSYLKQHIVLKKNIKPTQQKITKTKTKIKNINLLLLYSQKK